ncbi:MAG: TonB-dependent receptor [Rikenellaceae bacterium]
MSSLLTQIEKEIDYTFAYAVGTFDLDRSVSVKANNKDVKAVLLSVIPNIDIKYDGSKIIILPKAAEPKRTSAKDKNTITGVVFDENRKPLAGATVAVVGATTGCITDSNGQYSVDASIGEVINYSFIGYKQQNIAVTSRKKVDIQLSLDDLHMEEVVVVGYGSMKKSDLTGSISSMKSEDISSPTNSNLSQMIQGQAAGVVITQTSAQPGGATEMRIRGLATVNASSTPLYVIDGFPIDNTNVYPSTGDIYNAPTNDPLNSINPSDIERIDILKDASATAIYGSRAANGVVLITTKGGVQGTPKVTLNSSFGIQKIANRYEFLNGSEFAQVTNEMYELYGSDPYYTDAEVAAFGEGTDWFEEVTELGVITNHDISLQGGNEATKYMVSTGYYKNDGVIQNSSFERFSFRTNLEQKISSIVSLKVNSFLSSCLDFNVPVGSQAEETGILAGAYSFPSNVSVYDENGDYSSNPRYVLLPNPVSLLEIDDQTRTKRAMLNTSLNITPNEYLTIKLQGGTDFKNAKREYYNPQTTRSGADANGIASVTDVKSTSNLFEGTITYDRQLDAKNKINVVGGFTYQDFKYEELSALVSNFFTDYFGYNSIGVGETYSAPTTAKQNNKLVSALARANYNYDDRYLVTATFRADGSSKFAEGNRFGYFPSFSAAWNITNEQFMAGVETLSSLKLRLSYGETGNQDIGDNSYLNLLAQGYDYILGDSAVTTIVPGNAGNYALSWETAKQTNIGLDFALLDNRISGTLEVYQIITDNLLLEFDTPSYSGYESQWRNAGTISNRGIEFTLNSVNINKNDFFWKTTLTLAHNKNSWVDRAGLPASYIGASDDDPVNAIYGYVYDGIWQEDDDIANSAQPNSVAGNIRFKDVGGRDDDSNFVSGADGNIDDADITYLGTSDPKLEFGLTNTFKYKNWGLNIFFNGRLGGVRYNQFRSYYEDAARVYEGFNAFSSVLDRWTPDNPTSTIHSGASNPYGSSMNSYYVESTDFLRLQSLRLSYDTRIASLPVNLFLEGQNLFTITNYSGYDPEMGGTYDYNTYPASRTYLIGAQITF